MFLRLLATLLVLLCLSCSDSGGPAAGGDPDNYPTRPIRVIIPFGPGGLADVTLRLAGEKIGEALGQPLVMENRPGAGGVAATSAMLNTPADGHTLIVLTNGTTIAETQFTNLPYDISTELQPISSLAWFDLVLLTGRNSGYTSLGQLLEAARSAERGIRIATINPGSTQHLSAEWFRRSAGIDATIITYRTTPDVLGALLRNEVELVIDAYTALKGAIDNGDSIPLAVTGSVRNAALPHVPTAVEAGVEGYVVEGWNGLYTHAAVHPGIIERLQAALVQVTAEPEIQARFRELGVEARASTAEELREQFREDVTRWREVMVEAGLAP